MDGRAPLGARAGAIGVAVKRSVSDPRNSHAAEILAILATGPGRVLRLGAGWSTR